MTASGLKATLTGSILYFPHFSLVIHIAVLSIDLSIRVLGFDLEALIGRFVSICVGSIVVVLVDLLENGHRCGVVLVLRIRTVGRQKQKTQAQGLQIEKQRVE